MSDSRPDAPATRYELHVRPSPLPGGRCHLTIDGWKSLSDAPWDSDQKLHVVRTTHTVVAGSPDMASELNRIAPFAEKAAAWTFGFFAHNGRADYIEQKGFVLFVPSADHDEAQWFRAPTAKKPSGWTSDPAFVSGLAYPLPGVQLRVGVPDAPTVHALSTGVGGPREIITAAGRNAAPTELEGTLVHEFVHAVFANDNLGYYLGGKGVDRATVEGAARLVEAYFHSSPGNPAERSGGGPLQARPFLDPGIRSHFSSFDGRYPTDAQLYGSASSANYYYDLSASTFLYEASSSIGFALQCIRDSYVNGGGPFSGVVTKIQNGTVYFADPAQERAAWAAALRRTYG